LALYLRSHNSVEGLQISTLLYRQDAPQGEALIGIVKYLATNLVKSGNLRILILLMLNHVRLIVLSRLRYWGKQDFYSEIRLWNNIVGLITIDRKWAAQYRLEYPQEINQFIHQLKQTFPQENLRVLEIGSGPISKLREGTADFELYCLDPLASEYTRLHRIVKMKTNFKFIQATCEDLCQTSRKALFHLLYACNSLDHTDNPALCLEGMYNMLKPRGLLYVESHESEGSRLGWYGLHKFDLTPKGADLYLGTKDGKVQNITAKLSLKKIYLRRTPKERLFSIVWQKIPKEAKKESQRA
jgi:ubiquinone/menaquinone biosynthesis C-methylase UbiE